jgi:hypothetical protein
VEQQKKSFWKQHYADFLAAPMPAQPRAGRSHSAGACQGAHGRAEDAFAAIEAVTPGVRWRMCHFLRAITSEVQQKRSEVLVHIERGLDSLMDVPLVPCLTRERSARTAA